MKGKSNYKDYKPIIYKLNSGCCLSIDSVNVNKSRKMNIVLLSKNHLQTFMINDIMSLDLLLTLFTHSTSINYVNLCVMFLKHPKTQ